VAEIHPFQKESMGCMSRCSCGRTFSDPIHGEQSENLKRLREAVLKMPVCIIDHAHNHDEGDCVYRDES
jgi:hypothetical protein